MTAPRSKAAGQTALFPSGGESMEPKRANDPERVARAPQYREPPYEDLSSLVAGRIQAGPQSTPPRAGTDLDDWQDPELFHSPEL